MYSFFEDKPVVFAWEISAFGGGAFFYDKLSIYPKNRKVMI